MPTPRALGLRLAKPFAYAAGALVPTGPGLVVLLYHRVGAGSRSVDLPVERFERQLELLTTKHRVVPLRDGIGMASDASLREQLVAVTFDDGTADFHGHALPLLVRYGVPATHYVATAPVEERAPYPSRAGALDAPAMTWTQIDEALSTGLVDIGSHTHTHADLGRLPPAAIEDELRRAKGLIEDRTARACPDFAYPHSDRSPDADRLVRRYHETAAVGGWRTNRPGRVDPHRVYRVPITRADGPAFFRAKARGRMAAEAALYRVGARRG